jgi:hypothetical protein
MAKMDFFARYPDFFSVASAALKEGADGTEHKDRSASHSVESAMIRHHYGPWDKRYYP